MIKIKSILAAVTLTATGQFASAHDKNAPLSAEEMKYLALYEPVRAALAADDLPAARKAASELVAIPQPKAASEADAKRRASNLEASKSLAAAKSLADAREAFRALSRRAVHLVEGRSGYYRFVCPHIADEQGKWMQTTPVASNPYDGKGNPKCGEKLGD